MLVNLESKVCRTWNQTTGTTGRAGGARKTSKKVTIKAQVFFTQTTNIKYTYPPQVALALVTQGRILLPDAKPISTTRVHLTGVQPLLTVDPSKSRGTGTGVTMGYETTDTPIGTRVVITNVL